MYSRPNVQNLDNKNQNLESTEPWLGKTNALLDLIKDIYKVLTTYIDKIYFYTKDLREPKYELLIKKREYGGAKHFSNPNALLSVHESIGDYKWNRQRKVLTMFDDMVADIMLNKKFQAIIKEFFVRCRN